MKVKWVDINNGDSVNHDYRSRQVAKELKMDKRLDLFAATPPLEAKKALFSAAVTEGIGFKRGDWQSGMKLDFIDISRSFFQAEAIRDVYVELPGEDSAVGMCGKLKKSMYGSRDAAQNWGYAHTQFMQPEGFIRGLSSPCVFWNPDKELRCVVHRDDFAVLDTKRNSTGSGKESVQSSNPNTGVDWGPSNRIPRKSVSSTGFCPGPTKESFMRQIRDMLKSVSRRSVLRMAVGR